MDMFVMPRRWRPTPSTMPQDPAVSALCKVISSSITPLLDPDALQAIAEDLGCVQRNREHHAGLVADSLILSALQQGADTQGRWLDAQAVYERIGGPRTGATSYRNTVRKLVPLFKELLARRVRALGLDRPELQGRLRDFADVLMPDGCAFKIAAALADVWPGTSNPAEFKLHAVYSVRANGPRDLRQSAGCTHDTLGFKPECWEPHALYLWDLGYQDYDRFVEAALAGAIPLQRLKDKLNPVVLAWCDAQGVRHPVARADGAPMRLEEACEYAAIPSEGALDLDVTIRDARDREVVARVVCVPFEGHDRWYLTMLPRDRFTPFDIAELYRLRWEVELYFRTLRGAVRLDEARRMRHPASITVALLASLLAATLGQELTQALNAVEAQWCTSEPDTPPENRVASRPTAARCTPAPRETAGFSPRSDLAAERVREAHARWLARRVAR